MIVVAILGATWPHYEPSCRSPHYRRMGYYCLSSMSLVLVLMHWLSIQDGFDWLSIRLYACLPDKFPDSKFRNAFTISTIVCLAVALIVRLGAGVVNLACRFRCCRSTQSRHDSRTETLCGLWQISKPLPVRMQCLWRGCFIVPGCWIFLSVALYLFVKLRADFAAIMDDGDLRQWNFGQVLALMTWFPTVIDFVAVWSGKPLPKDYHRSGFRLLT